MQFWRRIVLDWSWWSIRRDYETRFLVRFVLLLILMPLPHVSFILELTHHPYHGYTRRLDVKSFGIEKALLFFRLLLILKESVQINVLPPLSRKSSFWSHRRTCSSSSSCLMFLLGFCPRFCPQTLSSTWTTFSWEISLLLDKTSMSSLLVYRLWRRTRNWYNYWVEERDLSSLSPSCLVSSRSYQKRMDWRKRGSDASWSDFSCDARYLTTRLPFVLGSQWTNYRMNSPLSGSLWTQWIVRSVTLEQLSVSLSWFCLSHSIQKYQELCSDN